MEVTPELVPKNFGNLLSMHFRGPARVASIVENVRPPSMLALVPANVRTISSIIKLVAPPAETEKTWLYTEVACVN